MFATTLFTALTTVTLTQSTSQYCNESFECAFGEDVSANTINCGGYFSCAFNTTITNNNDESDDGSTDCDGSYSCYGASSITITDSSLNCNGLMSCSDVEMISGIANIDCNGESSCYGSNIYYGQSLFCEGFRSCANINARVNDEFGSSITIEGVDSVSTVYLYDMLSGENSIFYTSNNVDRHVFYLYGTYSGSNTTIVCAPDTICQIECYGTESCSNNFKILCDSDSGNDGLLSDCNINVWCENGQNIDCYDELTGIFYTNTQKTNLWINNNKYQIPLIESLYDQSTGEIMFEVSSFDNSIGLCGLDGMDIDNLINYNNGMDDMNNFDLRLLEMMNDSMIDTDSIICADSNECTNTSVIVSGDGGHICCLGETSCSNVINLLPGDNGGVIRCDGVQSCSVMDENNTIDISDINSGDIYFSGYRAVEDEMNIIGNGDIDLYCLGRRSCHNGGSIEQINNVYITGSISAEMYNINQVNGNVHIYGRFASPYLSNVNGNVNCIANYGCYKSVFENINGNLFCYGRYSCYDFTFNGQSNGSFYAIGSFALQDAEINGAVENVIVSGENSLQGATISGSKNIIAQGNSAITDGTKIYSSDYWNELYIAVNGSSSTFEVMCNSGHSCTIICTNGCNVDLTCNGECTLNGVTEIDNNSGSSGSGGSSGLGVGEIIGLVFVLLAMLALLGYAVYRIKFKKSKWSYN